MMPDIFQRKLDVSDLRKYIQTQNSNIQKNLYKQCKILLIDDKVNDESYPFTDNINFLRQQFNCDITTKTDLDNLSDAAGYDIIICDYEGVGIKLRGKMGDGIWLVKQLQERYLDKIYILFSSLQFTLRKIKRVKAILWDKKELIRNSEENGDGGLTDNIQDIMKLYADPVKRWEDIRTQLLSLSLSIHEVAKLESAYVGAIIKKSPQIYSEAMSKVDLAGENSTDINQYINSASSIISTIISLISII